MQYPKYECFILIGGIDYTTVGPLQLIFDEENLEYLIPVSITDDQIHEVDKVFFGHLSSNETDIVLEPDEIKICIADNDGMINN